MYFLVLERTWELLYSVLYIGTVYYISVSVPLCVISYHINDVFPCFREDLGTTPLFHSPFCWRCSGLSHSCSCPRRKTKRLMRSRQSGGNTVSQTQTATRNLIWFVILTTCNICVNMCNNNQNKEPNLVFDLDNL